MTNDSTAICHFSDRSFKRQIFVTVFKKNESIIVSKQLNLSLFYVKEQTSFINSLKKFSRGIPLI